MTQVPSAGRASVSEGGLTHTLSEGRGSTLSCSSRSRSDLRDRHTTITAAIEGIAVRNGREAARQETGGAAKADAAEPIDVYRAVQLYCKGDIEASVPNSNSGWYLSTACLCL